MTTADIAGIRRNILEDPGADDLRLILADALQDSDDPRDRAEGEFVALSMRLASTPYCFAIEDEDCPACDLIDEIARMNVPGCCDHMRSPDDVPAHAEYGYWRGLPEVWAVADVPTFEREAGGVFSLHPIRRVVLRCEVGEVIAQRHEAFTSGHIEVSPAVWNLLAERDGWLRRYTSDNLARLVFDSPALARADLERACVVRGRRIAGLPDLAPAAR